jgi:hypothetical protein
MVEAAGITGHYKAAAISLMVSCSIPSYQRLPDANETNLCYGIQA